MTFPSLGLETETRFPEQRLRSPASGPLLHAVLKYSQIAAGRFTNVNVAADYIAIVSTFPVLVRADDSPLIPDEDQQPFLDAAPFTQPGSFQPVLNVGATGGVDIRFRPGLSFVIKRRTTRLSIEVSGDTTDYENQYVPGECHVFLGQGDVQEISWGLPISFPIELSVAGLATTGHTFSNIQPTLHGQNAASPSPSPNKTIPSRGEIYGLSVTPTWAGAAGLLTLIRLGMQAEAALGTFRLATYRPNTERFELDFGSPVEFYPLSTRQPPGVGLLGALNLRVEANINFSGLEAVLRCRGFM